MKKVTGVIPARYASTRFPGKPLVKIGSKTMIEWTWIHASKANFLHDLVVATDDKRIYAEVIRFGGKCIMTREDHPSGTDRIIEVAEKLTDTGIIVNIQGDEPGVESELINGVVSLKLQHPEWEMTTAAVLMTDNFNDPNRVKVVFDQNAKALYFSRSLIPSNFKNNAPVYRHLGIYTYEREFLLSYNALPESSYEISESLEQLRAIQAGKTIGVYITNSAGLSVDTPEDLEIVKEEFKRSKII